MKPKLPIVLSATALVVAVLGTTPLAAIAQNAAFPPNSVGSTQLKRNAVGAAKLAPNAVRTGHVLNGSLLLQDFKPGQVPQGPKGEKGDKGDKGDSGVKGDAGATNVVVRQGAPFALTVGSAHLTARCNPGERVVGGGAGLTADLSTSALQVRESKPWPVTGTPVGWQASASMTVNDPSRLWSVYVICASP